MNKKQAEGLLKEFVAIHITSYFPKKGIIRTRYATKPFTWLRDTAHFSLNRPAPDIGSFGTQNMRGASWSNKKFAILIPFSKLYTQYKERLQSIGERDTYFRGSITIPKGSIILITGKGVSDAMHNGITSQDEVLAHFGDMDSPVAKKNTAFYVKRVKGIEYRIYNYWEEWKVKELVKRVVEEMGFSAKLNIPWHLLNGALETAFKAHCEHWTSRMEDFGMHTKGMEKRVDYMSIFLKRLKDKGVTIPLTYRDGYPWFAVGRDETLIDAKGRTFKTTELYKGFSGEEITAGRYLDYSLVDDTNVRKKLQDPLQEAIRILQKVPEEYHETIQAYVRSYQAKIRKRLPKVIIKLCPNLRELVDQTY
jgi:hypothetical protein